MYNTPYTFFGNNPMRKKEALETSYRELNELKYKQDSRVSKMKRVRDSLYSFYLCEHYLPKRKIESVRREANRMDDEITLIELHNEIYFCNPKNYDHITLKSKIYG